MDSCSTWLMRGLRSVRALFGGGVIFVRTIFGSGKLYPGFLKRLFAIRSDIGENYSKHEFNTSKGNCKPVPTFCVYFM